MQPANETTIYSKVTTNLTNEIDQELELTELSDTEMSEVVGGARRLPILPTSPALGDEPTDGLDFLRFLTFHLGGR